MVSDGKEGEEGGVRERNKERTDHKVRIHCCFKAGAVLVGRELGTKRREEVSTRRRAGRRNNGKAKGEGRGRGESTYDRDLRRTSLIAGESLGGELLALRLERLEEGEGADGVDEADGEFLLFFVDLEARRRRKGAV